MLKLKKYEICVFIGSLVADIFLHCYENYFVNETEVVFGTQPVQYFCQHLFLTTHSINILKVVRTRKSSASAGNVQCVKQSLKVIPGCANRHSIL